MMWRSCNNLGNQIIPNRKDWMTGYPNDYLHVDDLSDTDYHNVVLATFEDNKVQNSLLRPINLYIYSIVYSTVEYIRISSNLCFRTTICSHYPIWAGSWPTSHFAIQAMSEFQFGWSQSTHRVWPHLAWPQLTRLDASNRLLKTRNMKTRSRRLWKVSILGDLRVSGQQQLL